MVHGSCDPASDVFFISGKLCYSSFYICRTQGLYTDLMRYGVSKQAQNSFQV